MYDDLDNQIRQALRMEVPPQPLVRIEHFWADQLRAEARRQVAWRITALAASVLIAAGASAQTKPNVVLIVMDDVGYGDYGAYGAPDIKTPNVDRLAKDGVRFTDFYAAPSASYGACCRRGRND